MASQAYAKVLRAHASIVVTEPPKFDLDSYIQNYMGSTKWARLYFIGTHSTVLCVDALKAAVIEAKKGSNRDKYFWSQQALARLTTTEPEAEYDEVWVNTTLNRNTAETAKLEAELKQYKNNLVKESIRMTHGELGLHLQNIGEFSKAQEVFGKMRQDCTNGDQIIEVSRYQISVSMERADWPNTQANAQRLIATTPATAEAEKDNLPYSKCVLGLSYLHQEKFQDAARAFLNVNPGMTAGQNSVMTPNDVAVYGATLALSTMNREELQRRVLDNADFRTYLELEPQLRKAVAFFVNGRYPQCLLILEGYRNDYLLDIHLSSYVSNIFEAIRTKSIVEYFVPFSCVTLDTLNKAFARPRNTIENELIEMIKSGKLEARIDMENKTLVAVERNPRAELQAQTLATANAYEREMRRRITRMNIIGAGLEVQSQKKQGVPFILPDASAHARSQNQIQEAFDHDSGYE